MRSWTGRSEGTIGIRLRGSGHETTRLKIQWVPMRRIKLAPAMGEAGSDLH